MGGSMSRPYQKTTLFCMSIIIILCMAAESRAQRMAPPDEAMKWAEETLTGLTLKKKVGQMICSDISGEYIADDDPMLKNWIRLARDYGIGGFVLYGGTPRDVAHLLNRLQKEADLPILMSADFEGGQGRQ